MPPKVKITKEEIVRVGVELIREEGEGALNARNIAARLQCSTQPIFSNFRTMQELREAIIAEAYRRYREVLADEIANSSDSPYKASGMGYIRFAAEEKKLFQLLYMRDRNGEMTDAEDAHFDEVAEMVAKQTGLPYESARLFHLEVWAMVHGIAAMIVTNYLTLDKELIDRMLSDIYLGLKQYHEGGEE